MFLEIVFASVLVISCIGFMLFLWKTNRQQTQPKVKRKRGRPPKKKEQKNDDEIPEEWRKDNPSTAKTVKPSISKKRIKLPGFKFIKQGIALILCGMNLFIALASLTSHSNTQPMFFFFGLNFLAWLYWLLKISGYRMERE